MSGVVHQIVLMYSSAMTNHSGADISVVSFLGLLGHRLRWRLLGELAESDRQVHELCTALGEPQSLVSYHLAQLREAGLVSTRRSSADRRDAYYTVNLTVLRRALSAAGTGVHPGLRLASLPSPAIGPGPRPDVLFVCTGNSARSQLAEAILRDAAGPAVDVVSAGSHPKQVHPHAVEVMAAAGIDLSTARAKHLAEFEGRQFSHVITLCDRVREVCPEFGGARRAHWNIPDPSVDPDGLPAFQRVADDLRDRVGFLRYRLAADLLDPAEASR
jgi:protein-tyrosine-phosphatase/DNA-binding MarR family transcriptional regulator